MKIILLGYMGSGKSIIGKKLSQKLDITHFDLDEMIENHQNLSISELFKTKGELYFRKLENKIFKEFIDNKESYILSLGGGTPCYFDNYKALNSNGIISIYLIASIETLIDNLKNDSKKRPILDAIALGNQKEFIAKHLFERSYFYNFATKKVVVDGKSVDAIAQEIISLLEVV